MAFWLQEQPKAAPAGYGIISSTTCNTFPFTYHDKTQTGEAIERCTSDVDALRRFFADQAIGVGRIVMLFTINFIALLNLNSKLAWISIIVVPPNCPGFHLVF